MQKWYNELSKGQKLTVFIPSLALGIAIGTQESNVTYILLPSYRAFGKIRGAGHLLSLLTIGRLDRSMYLLNSHSLTLDRDSTVLSTLFISTIGASHVCTNHQPSYQATL